jgi:hypothetical protein
MPVCGECGTPFHEATGWVPGVCGQCLGDQIEAHLMLQLLGPRKGAKRADEWRGPEVAEPVPERRTA